MDRYELRRIDYSLSDDHQAIQEAYKQFFKTHCSIETVRAAEESGHEPRAMAFDHRLPRDRL